MIVLFEVRWSATNISSPIATSESLTISTVKGSSSVFAVVAIPSGPDLDDHIAELVHRQLLAWEDDGRGGRLLDHRRTLEPCTGTEQRPLVGAALMSAELVE